MANQDNKIINRIKISDGQEYDINARFWNGKETLTAADLGLSAALKYCGITTTPLEDGSPTNPVIIGEENLTAEAGCVVFYGDKEFIFSTDGKWQLLGLNIKLATSKEHGIVKLVEGDMNGKAYVNGEAPSLNHTHSQYANANHTHSSLSGGDNSIVCDAETNELTVYGYNKLKLESEYDINLYAHGGGVSIDGSNTGVLIGDEYGNHISVQNDRVNIAGQDNFTGELTIYINDIQIDEFIRGCVDTPDWNAKEGEAGYIENKPFEKHLKEKQSYSIFGISDEVVSEPCWFHNSNYSRSDKIFVYINGGEFDLDNNLVFSVYDNSYIKFNNVSIYEGNIDFEVYFYLDGMDRYNYGHECVFEIRAYGYKQISSNFVSDVIKTKPQTLTDDEKNQALENIGLNIASQSEIDALFENGSGSGSGNIS